MYPWSVEGIILYTMVYGPRSVEGIMLCTLSTVSDFSCTGRMAVRRPLFCLWFVGLPGLSPLLPIHQSCLNGETVSTVHHCNSLVALGKVLLRAIHSSYCNLRE